MVVGSAADYFTGKTGMARDIVETFFSSDAAQRF
jgi:hypothetical protein